MPTINGQNYPGEYEVEILYSRSGIQHSMKLNCDVTTIPNIGDDPSTIMLDTRGGVAVALNTAVSAWVDLVRAKMPTAIAFSSYNFYRYTVGTTTKVWVAGATIGLNGTGGGTPKVAQQSTYTFRSSQGGRMKLILLNTAGTFTAQNAYSGMTPSAQAIVDFMLSNDAWMIARDNGYPVLFLREHETENEALYKKAYRS